ncbi:succinylglutamate desuccinylase/aspartoacylase family protein [Vibrio palustris]|uniref:Aspartoacylase n=1 Tax=Vibrio palustris TaxID=1918946 RepID=A0A1R4AZX9_9VIBR|nr:succinylglutamate desuccinylase/aspartoacylase family protein [Vibrio palustris]SJL82220.1 aspartoacylase [Vibrio palustris]
MTSKSQQTNSAFEILGQKVLAGSREIIELEVAKLYTNAPLSIPIEILHGASPGPVLLVNAAIHGDELNGVEIVRQLVESIDPIKLKGTLIAVPVVNVFGFIHKSRYLPDRRDLNRSFPGSEKGSLASRMAYTFFTQIAQSCQYIIDLHTGAQHRTNLPQIRADLSDEETLRIARAFGTPVTIDSPLRDGSLRSEAGKLGLNVLTYEAGEALRFDPIAIQAGLQGIKRTLQAVGMLRKSRKAFPSTFISTSTSWVRADTDGIVRTLVSLGDKVEKDQVLAYINSPLGSAKSELKAAKGGIVIGQQTLPLVNEGDALFNLAYFEQDDHEVEQLVEEFIEDISDMDLEAAKTDEN